MAKRSVRTPLTADERDGIILAVNSAFRKLKNLYSKIVPVFESYGFTPPSAGVIARDRRRPESEWIRIAMPPLQIVPEALWQAVHERLEAQRNETLRMQNGQLLKGAPAVVVRNAGGRPAGGGHVPYLLSGFMRCTCGSGYEAVSRKSSQQRIYKYGCAAHRHKGDRACTNARLIPVEIADEAVLIAIDYAVFRPDVIKAVIERTLAVLDSDQVMARAAVIERELREIKVALSNLIQLAAAGGGNLATLAGAMGEHEARQRRLETELAGLTAQQRTFDPAKAQKWIEDRLVNWKRLLRNNREQGRQVLQNVLTDRLSSDGLTFRGTATLERILSGGFGGNYVASPMPASWNRVVPWLRTVDQLRRAA
jgi:hypothetical protein